VKNGIPTNNVIPASYISPIAKSMQSFLPDPTNPNSLTANYTSGLAGGFDNTPLDYCVDYDINSRHRISTIGAIGNVVDLNNFGQPFLPVPYVGGTYADIHPKIFDVEDAYTISNSTVNQLKYGFVRFAQPQHNTTDGIAKYFPTAFGITNLPSAGQAGTEFAGAVFGTTTKFGTAMQQWTTNSAAASTQVTIPNNFTVLDNFQWVKGKHALTLGITLQWQQTNAAGPTGYTGILSLPYKGFATSQYVGTSLSMATAHEKLHTKSCTRKAAHEIQGACNGSND